MRNVHFSEVHTTLLLFRAVGILLQLSAMLGPESYKLYAAAELQQPWCGGEDGHPDGACFERLCIPNLSVISHSCHY